MIWEYIKTEDEAAAENSLDVYRCPFCECSLNELSFQRDFESWSRSVSRETTSRLSTCAKCGWWTLKRTIHDEEGCGSTTNEYGATSILRSFSFNDLSTPIEDVNRYLLAKYGDRLKVHPKLVERLVGSVFANLGCKVEVAESAPDDGIDVIVIRSRNDEQIGVQVKRYKNKIEAHLIRELAGALLLNQMADGIFVTMNDFTRGAKRTADRYSDRFVGNPSKPMKIKLWNAQRFYDAMRIATRPAYTTADDPDTPFYPLLKSPEKLPLLRTNGGGFE